MHVLTVNCGSSSLKFDVRRVEAGAAIVLRSGQVSGIDSTPQLTIDGERVAVTAAIDSHAGAISAALPHLVTQIDVVAHRVVHGGQMRESVLIDDAVLAAIDSAGRLAPLHNPPAIDAIRGCRTALPGVPMVAVFDTGFHASIPDKAAHYAIDHELADRHEIRRYGFHGIAHQFMTERYTEVTGRGPEGLKLVTLQLGSGCSAAAVRDGHSIDTSMGFSPLEGLVMETRSGDIDPAILRYLAEQEGMSLAEVDVMLNERSGLLGMTGLRSMRAVLEAEERGDGHAALAVDVFVYRVQKYIGAYLTVLGGLDALIFGGGIGENAPGVRARIVEALHWLGVELDEAANAGAIGVDSRISTKESSTDVWTLAVDEGEILAREAVRVLARKDGAWQETKGAYG